MRDFSDIFVRIARIADRQYGHVTRQQLLDLGVPSSTMAHWVTNRRLIAVHAGVYAVGHRQSTALAIAAAAVLACGERAVLSHDSAAALWGVRRWPRIPEVTTAMHRRRPGIRSHRSSTLASREVRRHRNIRVTSPARTIVDIQGRLTDAQLIRAINDMRIAKHMRASELHRLLEASPRAAALIDPEQAPTRSPLEDSFLVFCQKYGLPRPIVNTTLFGHEVDALFPAEKVIVELDGWGFHRGRKSFEEDRERDAIAAAHGYVVVRLTDARLNAQPQTEAARLHQTLALRRGGG